MLTDVLHSRLIHMLEFIMNHADLVVGDTESLSIDQTFDGLELIQQVDVVVLLRLDVNGVSVLVENLVVQWVAVPLLESHVHDSTEDLEQVFGEFLTGHLVRGDDFEVELRLSLLDLRRNHGGMDKVEAHKDVEDVSFDAPVGLELGAFENLSESEIKVSQLFWILLLNLHE